MSSAAYREAHREELAAKQRAWREANPDYQKAWLSENAEQVRETSRTYQLAHRDEINAKRRIRKGNRAATRRAMFAESFEERRTRRLGLIAQWKRDHPEKEVLNRRYNQTRKARLHGAFVERVDRFEVYDRAGGICGICKEPVSRTAFDVDHTIPLSRGGEHSYANTQPSHPSCNRRKHNRAAA